MHKVELIRLDEYELIQKVANRVLENSRLVEMCLGLCVEEYRESLEGSEPILAIVKDFLDKSPNEVKTFIFLHFLVYYPRSMTAYNLTPLLERLIAMLYFYSQNDKKAPKLSMDDLAELFNRSKSTIYAAVQKHPEAESMIKAGLLEEAMRKKAKSQAMRELVEEEKKKLLAEKEGQTNTENTK